MFEPFEYIAGKQQIDTQATDVVVFCVVKNGESYVNEFVTHHLEKGVKHIVIVDHGSSDQTVEVFASLDLVTVYRCSEHPFAEVRLDLLPKLINGYAGNCWSLVLDIDEFFDYPYGELMPLANFINYLNEYKFEAVTCQMLDMLGEQTNLNQTESQELSFLEVFKWFDVSSISKYAFRYETPNNRYANSAVKFHKGGSRKKIFGMYDIALTKMSLFKIDHLESIANVHFHHDVRVADISCVLFHYKYRPDFKEHLMVYSTDESFNNWNDIEFYKKYVENHENLDSSKLKLLRFETTMQLIDLSFLVISKEFCRYVLSNLKGVTANLDKVKEAIAKHMQLAGDSVIQKSSLLAYQEITDLIRYVLGRFNRKLWSIRIKWTLKRD